MVRSSLRWLRWFLRHPGALLHLARGLQPRDLVLRADLARMGFRLSPGEARGLGASGLNATLVSRLARAFADLPPRTLLDIGAARGSFSVAAGLAFPGLRAFAFEPQPGVFPILARVATVRPGIRAFPLALGERPGRLLLHLSRSPGSSSLLRMLPSHEEAWPGTETYSTVEVEVRTLDEVVRAEGLPLDPPVLMKLDVQGFEERVLRGAEEVLGRVDFVVVEMSLLPLYEGQALRPAIRERLEGLSFSYEGLFDELRSSSTGEVLQVDGLFRKA